MWALVIFTIATTGPASSTVTSIEFGTQQLCLIAEQKLKVPGAHGFGRPG